MRVYSVHVLNAFFTHMSSSSLMFAQALETRTALQGAAPNSPQSTAVQLYAVINAQSGVVKAQVLFIVSFYHKTILR